MKFGEILLTICVAIATLHTASAENMDETFANLETRWQDAMRELNVPGLSVAVVREDKLVYANGFGVRQVDPSKEFTADTICYIASSTKPFVAMAILQLVDAGKVDLDKPVKTYLPRFELPDADLANSITVRDLLCHRYGLSNGIVTLAEAYTGEWDDDFYYDELARSTEARGSWSYSNLHYTLAGRIVQAVTGKTWQDYLRDEILEPLGMNRTTAYASRMYADDNVALGLVVKDGHWTNSDALKIDKTMHAAGGMGTTARDLAQWIRLNMSDGAIDGTRIVSEARLDEMLTEHVQPKSRFFQFGRERMGLSWYLGSYKDELLVHHFGGYIGYHAHVSFMPEHNVGVAVLANSDREGSMLIHQIAADVYNTLLNLPGDDFLPRLVERTAKIEERERIQATRRPPLPDGPLDLPSPLEAYAGTYTSDRWGALTLNVSGDTLVGGLGNLGVTIHPRDNESLTLVYALGREILTFKYAPNGSVAEAHVKSWGPHTMVFTRTEP